MTVTINSPCGVVVSHHGSSSALNRQSLAFELVEQVQEIAGRPARRSSAF
jgi:hypothetical protein